MEVCHETDEQVGELCHGLDTGAEESHQVFPMLKAVVVLSNKEAEEGKLKLNKDLEGL